jgi:hypothetical protein
MGIFFFKEINERPVTVEAARFDGQCDRYLFCMGNGRRGVYSFKIRRVTAGGQESQQQDNRHERTHRFVFQLNHTFTPCTLVGVHY